MPVFDYQGRGADGESVKGSIEATSLDSALSQLSASAIIPIDISETRSAQVQSVDVLEQWNKPRPKLDDIILFSRQMYSLMKAGIPIIRAMTGIIRATRNARLVDIFRDLQSQMESGRELSSGLAKHKDVFSPLYISMIRVGENSGRLDESFLRLTHYLEMEKETRQRVKSAVRYPLMVIFTMAIAIGIINWKVIPAFAGVFERANVELPIFTRILMATSDFTVQYGVYIVIALIVLSIGFMRYINTESGRYVWGRYKIRMPLVGDILFRATLGRFARSFSMSLNAGVPIIQALTVTADAVDNDYVGGHIRDMRNGIERGESLTRRAAATDMFSPLVLQMMSVGEETGRVDEMMEEVAGFYEREVDYDVKNLSSIIEPVLIVLMGGLVLILALGVFLPMWDLASVSFNKTQ